MRKFYLSLLIAFIFSAVPVFAATKPTPAAWKPATPDGYTPITWAKAPGIATFFKAPDGNGTIDFLTRIYLPQNQIGFISSSSTPLDWGLADPNFTPDITANLALSNADVNQTETSSSTDTTGKSGFHNYAFMRLTAEVAKRAAPIAKFVWNAPFFNITNPISDLSLALKYSFGTTTLISSGSRPSFDMAHERRMLVINNKKGTAIIKSFDSSTFVSSTVGDQAVEGFAPTVVKSDSANGTAARLFLGVSSNNKELVVYCSQQATVQEASAALTAAGVSPEHQLEADGGGSATCGYNLPGQFFVEPTRTLPLLMGASTILARGTVVTDYINVRSGPSTKNSIVTKLPKGSAVRAFEEKNGWFRIGDKQWILKTLIKKV